MVEERNGSAGGETRVGDGFRWGEKEGENDEGVDVVRKWGTIASAGAKFGRFGEEAQPQHGPKEPLGARPRRRNMISPR